MNVAIIKKAMKKAQQSLCHYRISAIGLNYKGDMIYSTCNKPRFSRFRGSIHAEMDCMLKAGPGLTAIIICRIGLSGKLRKIEPCSMCLSKAQELGIKIYTIQDDYGTEQVI